VADEDPFGEDGYQTDPEQDDGSEEYTHDSDAAGGGNYPTLPTIVYRAELESWEKKTASTGRKQFEVRFRVKGPEEYAGRVIFWRTNVGSDFDWTRQGYFAATGRGGKFSWSPKLEVDGAPEVGILIGHRKGDTRTFEEIKEFYPPTDPRVPGHEMFE